MITEDEATGVVSDVGGTSDFVHCWSVPLKLLPVDIYIVSECLNLCVCVLCSCFCELVCAFDSQSQNQFSRNFTETLYVIIF